MPTLPPPPLMTGGGNAGRTTFLLWPLYEAAVAVTQTLREKGK